MSRNLLVAAAVGLLMIGLSVPGAADEPDPAGNGIVMMIHANFEPWVEGPPPALEALAATPDGDRIRIHAITYSAVADTRPVAVGEPALRIVGADGEMVLSANGDPADSHICEEETNLPGHEGPLAACAVFDLPASDFDGRNIVHFELLFVDGDGHDGIEVYNAVAHYFLHGWMESGGNSPMDLETVDATFTQPTPFVVQNLVDPVA